MSTTLNEINRELKLSENGMFLPLVNTNMFILDRFAGGEGGGDAMSHVIRQAGLNWSVGKPTVAPDPKAVHTVSMTDNEWAYIVDACSVYNDILCQIYKDEIAEHIRNCISAIGEAQRDGRL